MYNCIICRYHEIATKGNNRNMFEKCLVDNIRYRIKDAPVDCKVRRVRGRVWLEPEKGTFSAEDVDSLKDILSGIFGLHNFSPAILLPVDIDAIRECVSSMLPERFRQLPERKEGLPTFRIRARRSNKRFPMTSKEIEIDLISCAAKVLGNNVFKIDLDHADLTLGCEIRDEFSILYFDTFDAPGGLPVGSNPRVLTLLSGGIDSPVAAWMIMKRGSATDFVTFHSSPYTPPETVDKVAGIAEKLNRFQREGKLFAINLLPLQKAVRDYCSERMRTVLYRRAMLRIAEMIARKRDCRALVTGDALGQVASQTVVNMDTINRAIDMLVLRPLVGQDKLETIEIARKIGTFEDSSVQVPDSCTVFAPNNPSTSVPAALAEAEEAKIPDYPRLLESLIEEFLPAVK